MHTVIENACENISLITEPSIDILSKLWCSRLSIPDEIRYAFADASPGFEQFVEGVDKGEILCALTENENGELVAASWLHDFERDPEGEPRVAWVGAYVFPGHRGAAAVASSRLVLQYYEDIGIQHIHTAIHIDNRKSQLFTRSRSMMAFTFVCQYPEWTTFGGEPADALIFTQHAHDKMLAWMCARKLASQRLLSQE